MFLPRITSWLMGIGCLASVVFAQPERGNAQLPRQRSAAADARPSTEQASSPADAARAEGQIRLNHVQASWRKVLEDLAKSMNVVLVMPDELPGYYSRFDRTLHTHAEAIRILDREIEEHGFRLVSKSGFLLVLELDAGRPEYERPLIPGRPRATGREGAGATTNSEASSNVNMRRLPPIQVEQGQQSPVRQAGFQATMPKDAGTAQILRLPMKQQRADLVAERLFAACRGWATPTGHPQEQFSFRVDLRGAGSAPAQIVCTTDLPTNELVLQTPPQLADAVTRLVRSFDSQGLRPGASERLIAGVDDATGVARRVQTPLNSLRLQQQTQRVAARQLPEPPPAAAAGQNPSNALKTIEQLSGDVSVDAIEDLGILILRGDSGDVDAVANLVNEIAKLGVGAAPEIHLLMLSFVNSESLSELLKGVFERSKSREATGGVAVFPVRSPNAVLIVAPAALMPVVLELADKLDQPGDPSSVFRVFALKQAVATQVLDMLEDFYEPKGGLAARIKAVVDVRTNSLIVQGAPRDLDEVAALIQRIDHDESKAVSQMRIFALQNAVAEELVEVINTALRAALSDPLNQTGAQSGVGASPANGGGERTVGGAAGAGRRTQSAKSVVLQFLAADGVNREQIRSGILSDIRASADARTNSLVVTAPEQSMALMAELIRQLDTPTAMVAEIKVFTLANADATAMSRLLETLFSSPAQQQRLGVQVAGAEGASSGLIPLKFSVDVRTNSILATGGAEALRVMEAILLRLDQSDLRQRRSVVYKLRNSPARDVADAINQFLASQQALAQVDPNLVSTVEQVEREVIVVPELVSNSLLISSTPRHYDEIMELTQQLDQPPPQVIIQALLVEVVLSNNDEFGVELGVQDSVLFDRSAISDIVTVTDTLFNAVGQPVGTTQRIVSQGAVPGFGFNNQPLGNNPSRNTSTVGTQGLSNFSVGRVNSDLGYGGLVLSAGSESVNVLVRALAAKRKIDVLSRPQIRTLDNQLATIQVGQQVPIVDGVAVSGTGSANPVVRQDQAGVILSVTPRISPDEVIVMEVSAEKSQYTGQGVPLFTDANNGNVIESPIKDIIKASTTISVPNGQTVVLGGMITTLDDVIERKVPWLGDLPLVGRAFRYDSKSSRRTELLIFLTPRVVHNSVDSEMIKQVEASRLHYVEHAAEAVHGPLFGVPEEPGLQLYELPAGAPNVRDESLEPLAPTPSRRLAPTLADPAQP